MRRFYPQRKLLSKRWQLSSRRSVNISREMQRISMKGTELSPPNSSNHRDSLISPREASKNSRRATKISASNTLKSSKKKNL